MEWPVPEELQEKGKIKEKVKSFSTHVELDEFVTELLKTYPLFDEEFPEDWKLLKSKFML